MLKPLFKQIGNSSKQIFFFSGINSFWAILSNKPATNSINNLSGISKALSISCFEDSKINTKIPHNKLFKIFNELVDFCFKGIEIDHSQ